MHPLSWSQYAMKLPDSHENHYIESSHGVNVPYGLERLKAKYLLDKHDNIVGFTIDNKKFIFSNVTDNSGKILSSARFEIEKDDVDQAIKEYLVINEDLKRSSSKQGIAHHSHDKKLRSDATPLSFIKQPHAFAKIPGQEYGISEHVYKGANLLENKNRKFIGFRHNGKDFFIDSGINRLSGRYKPDMLLNPPEKKLVEQFVDKYLELVESQSKKQQSTKEVKQTQVNASANQKLNSKEPELQDLDVEIANAFRLLTKLIEKGKEIRNTATSTNTRVDFKALSENNKKIIDVNEKLLMLQNKRKMLFDALSNNVQSEARKKRLQETIAKRAENLPTETKINQELNNKKTELNKLNNEITNALRLLTNLIKEGKDIRANANNENKKVDFKALSENTKKIKDVNEQLLLLQEKKKKIADEFNRPINNNRRNNV